MIEVNNILYVPSTFRTPNEHVTDQVGFSLCLIIIVVLVIFIYHYYIIAIII